MFSTKVKVGGVGPVQRPEALILFDAPYQDEIYKGGLMQGRAGVELAKMLHEAGYLVTECRFESVAQSPFSADRCEVVFPSSQKKAKAMGAVSWMGKSVHPDMIPLMENVHKRIANSNPAVIIPVGSLALFTLIGETTPTKWRGSQLQKEIGGVVRNIVPTLNPLTVVRRWDWRWHCVRDLKRALDWTLDDFHIPERDYKINPSFPEACYWLNNLQALLHDEVNVTVDIETRYKQISCISFSTNKASAFCIPIMSVLKPEGYWSESQEFVLVKLMKLILEDPNCLVCGQNFSYDYYYLASCWGIKANVVHDTMVAQHVLWPGTTRALDFLSSIYCSYHRYWKDEGKGYHDGVSTVEEELEYWEYNDKDSVVTHEVRENIIPLLKAKGLYAQYRILMDRFHRVNKVVLKGTKIDLALRNRYRLELMDAIAVRENRLYDLIGHSINLQSPKQLQTLFYTDFDQKVVKNRKTGRVTTDKTALAVIAKREPLLAPVCQAIEEVRSLQVFLGTFVNAELDSDGRIRCTYNIAGPETFRYSSNENPMGTGTNLQNIPAGRE